ncbi:MAG: ferredoxin [Planctomycetota bacterium]
MGKPSVGLSGARKKATKLSFDRAAFTLVVCMDRKSAKCCSAEAMSRTWRRIKECSKEFRLRGQVILRIKSQCIGVCRGGPIIGVFPDGIWYGACTPAVVDRIFDDHLACGRVLVDHVIACPTDQSNR